MTSTINKNTLFIPSSGYYDKTNFVSENDGSCLWTMIIRENDSEFYVNNHDCDCSCCERYFGYNIIGVVE